MSGQTLLVIDAGNTNLTFGLYRGERLARRSRMESVPAPAPSALSRRIASFGKIDAIAIASVVPSLDARLGKAARAACGQAPFELTPRSRLGIRLLVDTPNSVGADRLANALAAHRAARGPAIVVDFGTATTFDCVDGRGDYLGGARLPGPGVASRALSLKAEKLPEIPIRPMRRVIGKNTVECLQAGLYFGYLGMIDRVLEETIREMGGKKPPAVLVTGGLGRLFCGALRRPAVYLANLTLEGIRLAATGTTLAGSRSVRRRG